MRNTGKPTEKLFEDSITALGKDGYFYRIKDAAAIKGITGRVGAGIDATPSDYICAVRGKTFFCEVKSTIHLTLFEFKLIRKGQSSHATRIVAAGGMYLVMVHAIATNEWYLLPKSVITGHEKQTKRKSMTWLELERYKCSLNPVLNLPSW